MPDDFTPGAGPDDDVTLTVDRTRASNRRASGAQEALRDDTARVAAPIATAPTARRPFAVTLPQHPPVTDYRRLDFSPPEVLPGSTVHYPVRAGRARELPDFVAEVRPSRRVASVASRRGAVAAAMASGELQRSRAWHARAMWTITASTVAAALLAVAGFYGLARL